MLQVEAKQQEMDRIATLQQNNINSEPAAVVASAEDTPAYKVLQACGLLTTAHRKEGFFDIFNANDLTANSSTQDTFLKKLKW